MKITTLLETNTTPASDPAANQSQQAPKFGRDPKVLEDDEQLDETTSGAIATVAQPVGGMQKRGKGSIFSGVKTSKKFPNSAAVKQGVAEGLGDVVKGIKRKVAGKEDPKEVEHMYGRIARSAIKHKTPDQAEKDIKRWEKVNKVVNKEGAAEDQINESPTIDFIRGLISEFNKEMSGSPYYPMDYKNPGMRMWTRGDGSKYKDPGYIFIDRDLKPEDIPKWHKAGAVEKFWKFLESKGARKIGDVSGEFGSDPHSPAVVLNKLIFVFNGRSIAWGSTSRLKNSSVWRQKQQGVAEATERFPEPEQEIIDATRRARLYREREPAGSDKIDAMLAQQHAQRQEYDKTGKFWLKTKDTQRHIEGPFIGKQAANQAALDLLKRVPELKGNLLITAWGPDETPVTEAELSEEQLLARDLKKQLELFKKGIDNELGNKPSDNELGDKPKDKEIQKKK